MRVVPVAVLVGREADGVVGVAVAQEVDLVQLQLVVLGRVDRDAVVDARSGMLRFSKNVTRSSMSLSDEPPVETITGLRVLAILSIRNQSLRSELAILMIWTPELDAEVDRLLVERRGHGDAAALADRLDEGRELSLRQLGVERLLDVADVRAVAEILVDEASRRRGTGA